MGGSRGNTNASPHSNSSWGGEAKLPKCPGQLDHHKK